jgi:5-methylcytosine-specific restriction endonuclease McrBC GTP-binding regulatory subunit McrB
MAQQLKEDIRELRGRITEKRLADAITHALIGTVIPDETADLRIQQLKREFDHAVVHEVWKKTEEARKLKHDADTLKMEYEKKMNTLNEQQERDKKTAESVRTLLGEFFEAGLRDKKGQSFAYMYPPWMR